MVMHRKVGFEINFPLAAGMPRKIRELIRDLEAAGFSNRGGKGSHRNFVHPRVANPVTIAGKLSDDARQYQERAVERAIEESKS
jgi:predicted RNA binding protein YcfA (HicA-like mRNA interferase family)